MLNREGYYVYIENETKTKTEKDRDEGSKRNWNFIIIPEKWQKWIENTYVRLYVCMTTT